MMPASTAGRNSPHFDERLKPVAPRIVRRDSDAITVDVAGEIDMDSAPLLHSCLNDCLADGCSEMTLDMTDLTFIDSSGLRVLVEVINQLRAGGGRLILRNPPPMAQRILGITGLTPYLELVTSDPIDH